MRKLLLGLLASAAIIGCGGIASAQIVAPNLSASPVITASSGAVSANTTTATLAAPNAGAWEVTQLEITGAAATGAAVVPCTITGLMGGTMTMSVIVGTIATAPPQVISFNGGLSAIPGTAVVFSCPTFGSGNVNAAINIHAILVH